MRKLGYRVVVISGGFDILINRFKKDLVFDSVFSNKLIFKDNMLFDIEMNVTSNKAKILKSFMGENREECKEPDLKIAFNAQPIVKKYADVVINEKDLLEIIPHLQNCKSSLDNPLPNLVAIVDGTNDLALFGVYKTTSDLSSPQARVKINERGSHNNHHSEVVDVGTGGTGKDEVIKL